MKIKIEMEPEDFEDLKHNMTITLEKKGIDDPDERVLCIHTLLSDLKGMGIELNSL